MSITYDDFKELISKAMKENAKDIHFKIGESVYMRNAKDLVVLDTRKITREDFIQILDQILDGDQKKILEHNRTITFSTDIEDVARGRIHVYGGHNGYAMVIRLFPVKVGIFADWNLPEGIVDVVQNKQGFNLITGAVGQGKTSTVSILLDLLSKTRRAHIVTLEKNVEINITSTKSLITRKEVGTDVIDYKDGLEQALLENADVIFVDEPPQTPEIFDLLLQIAESGVLVFATMNSPSPIDALKRILKIFPDHLQGYYRDLVADTMQMFSGQFLVLPSEKDKPIPILEIILATTAMKNLVREGKISQIMSVIEGGNYQGMQTFDQSIIYFYSQNILTYEDALYHLSNKRLLE